jgi:hypothetical protein
MSMRRAAQAQGLAEFPESKRELPCCSTFGKGHGGNEHSSAGQKETCPAGVATDFPIGNDRTTIRLLGSCSQRLVDEHSALHDSRFGYPAKSVGLLVPC